MSRLYKRACKVTLITPSGSKNAYFAADPGKNAVEITGLRVKFEIERHVKRDPNRCEVTVTNLAPATRTLCEQQKPLIVWIDAGYDGVLYQLFTGDVRHAWSELEKPDWNTHMQLGDGDRAYRLARVNRSFSAGTSILTAVKEVSSSMGLTIDGASQAVITKLQQQFREPRAVQGASRDELTRILAPLGMTWSIQNGRLQVLSDADSLQGQAILVSQDTGLLGSPSYTPPLRGSRTAGLGGHPPMLKFKMLLEPRMQPGGLVEVHSRDIKGKLFRVQRMTHRGDTHGSDNFTEVEALPFQPGSATEQSTVPAGTSPST